MKVIISYPESQGLRVDQDGWSGESGYEITDISYYTERVGGRLRKIVTIELTEIEEEAEEEDDGEDEQTSVADCGGLHVHYHAVPEPRGEGEPDSAHVFCNRR